MSLRKCPDCSKDVSSSAPSCPHCGRPRKKSHLPLEVVGGLSIASIFVVALAWHSGSGGDEAKVSSCQRRSNCDPPCVLIAEVKVTHPS